MMGKKADVMQENEPDSPLKVKLAKLAKQISPYGYIGAIVIDGMYYVYFILQAGGFGPYFAASPADIIKDVVEAVSLAVVIIVCAMPEGLPLLIPVAVAYLLCTKSWLGRLLGLLSVGTGCMAMAMTYSRASWVGLALAAVVFVILWNSKLIPLGIVVALVGLALLPGTVIHRLLTNIYASATSTSSR